MPLSRWYIRAVLAVKEEFYSCFHQFDALPFPLAAALIESSFMIGANLFSKFRDSLVLSAGFLFREIWGSSPIERVTWRRNAGELVPFIIHGASPLLRS